MPKKQPGLFARHYQGQSLTAFDGVCVRLVLSGYTESFLAKQLPLREKYLQEFYPYCLDIIQRYQAVLESWDGVQLVFTVRGERGSSAGALALSVVRDIFSFTLDKPHFYLKAVMAEGVMHPLQIQEKIICGGMPMIESLRLLGAVEEKSENLLIFFRTQLAETRELCVPRELAAMSFRGLEADARLCQVRSFTTMTQILQGHMKWQLLFYFRSDADYRQLLTAMIERLQSGNFADIKETLSMLRVARIEKLSVEMASLFKSFFNLLLRLQSDKTILREALEELVGLVPHFIPRQDFDDEIKELLVLCLNVDSKTMQNRAQDVLSLYCHEEEVLLAYSHSQLNRVLMDKLLMQNEKGITPDWLSLIKSMLAAKNGFQTQLALYVIGQVVENIFLLGQQTAPQQELENIFTMVEELSHDQRDYIRRRAMMTLHLIKQIKLAS